MGQQHHGRRGPEQILGTGTVGDPRSIFERNLTLSLGKKEDEHVFEANDSCFFIVLRCHDVRGLEQTNCHSLGHDVALHCFEERMAIEAS